MGTLISSLGLQRFLSAQDLQVNNFFFLLALLKMSFFFDVKIGLKRFVSAQDLQVNNFFFFLAFMLKQKIMLILSLSLSLALSLSLSLSLSHQ